MIIFACTFLVLEYIYSYKMKFIISEYHGSNVEYCLQMTKALKLPKHSSSELDTACLKASVMVLWYIAFVKISLRGNFASKHITEAGQHQ